MPKVNKLERYVTIGYNLKCGFERCQALCDDLLKVLKDDDGLWEAEDASIGFDGPTDSHAKVTYRTMADAIRLDPVVRRLLSRKADFTYDPCYGTSYSGRGPTLTVNPRTTLTQR